MPIPSASHASKEGKEATAPTSGSGAGLRASSWAFPETGGGSSAHSHRGRGAGRGERRVFLWILGALVVAAPSVMLPDHGAWLAAKAFALEAAGILLAMLIFSRGDWTLARLRVAVLTPVNLTALVFLAWVGLSVVRAPFPELARYEGMRYLGGGLVYFSVLYSDAVRRRPESLLGVLALACGIAALFAFVAAGDADAGRMTGAFHNPQLLAAFLALVLPLTLASAFTESDPWRRMGAQGAAVLGTAAVVVTQNRSAWLAVAVAAVAWGLLQLLCGRTGGIRLRASQLVMPAVLALVAGGIFWSVPRITPTLTARAGTMGALTQDPSFRWRLGMWNKALRMIRDRPLTGWGVGSFPIEQALFYHPDAPTRSQLEIAKTGPGLSESAHNLYLQLGAELGAPGLLAYAALFLAFFWTAARAVSRLRPGYRRSLLIACMAAVLGQMVAAMGSPAWEFPECSLFLWLVLGLGMSAAGVAERGRAPVAKPSAQPVD